MSCACALFGWWGGTKQCGSLPCWLLLVVLRLQSSTLQFIDWLLSCLPCLPPHLPACTVIFPIMYTATIMPFQIFFLGDTSSDPGWNAADITISVLFGLDIIMSFNVGYYDSEGWPVNDRCVGNFTCSSSRGPCVHRSARVTHPVVVSACVRRTQPQPDRDDALPVDVLHPRPRQSAALQCVAVPFVHTGVVAPYSPFPRHATHVTLLHFTRVARWQT